MRRMNNDGTRTTMDIWDDEIKMFLLQVATLAKSLRTNKPAVLDRSNVLNYDNTKWDREYTALIQFGETYYSVQIIVSPDGVIEQVLLQNRPDNRKVNPMLRSLKDLIYKI